MHKVSKEKMRIFMGNSQSSLRARKKQNSNDDKKNNDHPEPFLFYTKNWGPLNLQDLLFSELEETDAYTAFKDNIGSEY